MPPATTSSADLEIQLASGEWLPLMLKVARDQAGNPVDGAPKSLTEALAASDADLQVSKRLIPVVQEDWSKGFGVDYDEAPGVYTRTPGYALPAGYATPVTLPATHNSNSLIVAMVQYQTDLWLAQNGDGAANTARVLRSVAGTGVLTESLSLGAGEFIRDLLVFDDGAGNAGLYASSCSVKDPDPGSNGRLHRWNGTAWTSTAAGTFGANSRQRLAKVFWVTQDGVGAWRMVAISSRNQISYTKPGADPLLAASWVEGVVISTGVNLLRLVAARRHVYVTAEDGLFDLDEQGNSPALADYFDSLIHGANGLAAQYHDGYVYNALGQGLDRIKVDAGPVLQENVGQCAPGWGTRAENQWRGWTTALTTDQGFLVNAIFNPSTGYAGVFWGKDRTILGADTPNPLVWYGPEITLAGGYKIYALRTAAIANDDLRLFVAGFQDNLPPVVFWVSLPVAGSPIQDLTSGGKHRYAQGLGGAQQGLAYLKLLPETWDDKASLKILHQHAVGSRGLDAPSGTKLALEARADPSPGSSTWPVFTDITTSPVQTITPATVTSGNKIERRISFISPQGAATPPKVAVLDSVRTTAWRVVPAFSVRTIEVEYGAGVLDLANQVDRRDPDDVTAQLVAATSAGRLVIRDRQDRRWTMKLEQVLNRQETLTDDGKTVAAQLEVTVIGEAA